MNIILEKEEIMEGNVVLSAVLLGVGYETIYQSEDFFQDSGLQSGFGVGLPV